MIPILAIAYDNIRVQKDPVRWNMSELLTVSSVVSSFLLFYFLQEKGLPEAEIRTLLFFKLIVAVHSTLYVTRINDGFWRKPWPSGLLFNATFGTEAAAVGKLIAVFGVFVTPIPWQYTLGIWLYAMVWFLINDVIKVGTYRIILNRHQIK